MTSPSSGPGWLGRRSRELSHFRLRVVLLDGAEDVGTGTGRANPAIWHTGFDAEPLIQEARHLRRGHGLLRAHAARTGIPMETVGALRVGWSSAKAPRLPGIRATALRNGWTDVRPVAMGELRRREPELGPGAVAGL
ncbi:MAG TPA: FAD-dependent oxidoreductase [Verrucomicrobiae bacterium]|nr:FAD-dependent oxidoreductase [Verrucomicrobiae bacterium]